MSVWKPRAHVGEFGAALTVRKRYEITLRRTDGNIWEFVHCAGYTLRSCGMLGMQSTLYFSIDQLYTTDRDNQNKEEREKSRRQRVMEVETKQRADK